MRQGGRIAELLEMVAVNVGNYTLVEDEFELGVAQNE